MFVCLLACLLNDCLIGKPLNIFFMGISFVVPIFVVQLCTNNYHAHRKYSTGPSLVVLKLKNEDI